MAKSGETDILGIPTHCPQRRDIILRDFRNSQLSSAALVSYCYYEALDFSENPRELWKYFYPNFNSVVFPRYDYGIFSIPSGDPELTDRCLAADKFIMRWTSRVWRCIKCILVYVSRRVSGISKAEDVTLVVPLEQNDETTTQPLHKCSGYYGWGKIALVLDPVEVCERVRSEFTNLSIVSALFLTITVPLLTIPPDAVLQFSNESSISWLTTEVIQTFYVISCGGAVACQIATVTTAVSMITNLNKCQATSGETGVLFIKSIFNPYNGLTGTIGPMLYVGSLASWFWTMWVTIFTCIATFNSPVDIWAWHFALMALVCVVYLLQLNLGIMAEFHVMTPELNRFAADPQAHMDEKVTQSHRRQLMMR